MPLRRVRDETLVLRSTRSPNVADRVLVQRRGSLPANLYDLWERVPSQRRFQVSPDARVLAYTQPDARTLHLLRRDGAQAVFDGVSGGDLRFSPDGSVLAVVREVEGLTQIDRVDLRRFSLTPWCSLKSPRWIEFCAAGLVVAHEGAKAESAISLVPWEGPPALLVEVATWVDRVAAAKAGTRVVYQARGELFSIDGPGASPERIADALNGRANIEMSPDGRQVAIATDGGLLFLEGNGPPKLLGSPKSVHSVWFSRGGAELAWAGADIAVWMRGAERRELWPVTSEGSIAALRFLAGSPGLIISRGREVVIWNPDREEEIVVTKQEDAKFDLLGADLFGGGIVMWLGATELSLPVNKRAAAR